MIRILAGFLFCAAVLPAQITNDYDIVRMKIRGATDQQMIEKIANSEAAYSLWTDDLRRLHADHISDVVIRAMFARNVGPINPAEILHPPALPPGMSAVTIHSNPPGARIYVGGIEVGRTPMTFPMPPGIYAVTLLLPGHLPSTGRVAVELGKPASLVLAMTPQQ